MSNTQAPLVYISEKIKCLDEEFTKSEFITVLLVEDSRTVRMLLRGFIEQLKNVTLIEADTLAEARRQLEDRNNDFFCIIVDLTLPDVYGIETVDAVRAFNVPIIVLTGSYDLEMRKEVLNRHVVDYMIKSSVGSFEEVAYLIGRLRQNRQMTVMVVDDSTSVRVYFSSLLEQYQFNVISAVNGREGIELLKTNPDTALIITDYHMPEMDGLEMIRHIRQQHRSEDLAIIGLSSGDFSDLAPVMIKAGANDFVSKQAQPEEFYCRVMQNISLVRFVRQLRDLANRDYLTYLHNRRYLFETIQKPYSEAVLGQRKLAVGLVDADHFKHVNDTYGHTMGDIVLRKIADMLRKSLPNADILARYGGEEFVCVLTPKNDEDAAQQFDFLRQSIESFDFTVEEIRIPVTVSIGFTTQVGQSISEMIDHADQALYQAKEMGRNRVIQL